MTQARNVAEKLIDDHLVDGERQAGSPIALAIDQTLTQDATGTLVMLALEAMELDRARTEASVQYVDHNLLQVDNLNPDDHLFLESACRRFGLWFSRPGNGVSHPLHMQRFGAPGKTLLGSDSHTCASGSIGMLAIGAGGLDVAMAISGEPFAVAMPEVFGVRLTGSLPDWVSAKDVILEMLRRHGVAGGVGRIIEYYGPGLASLSAMDRHVIANMGAELGATTTVFPSDAETRRFLASEERADDWRELVADEGCDYDIHDEIDLGTLEPLIARPSSPGNVVPVTEVAGEEIVQSYIGSSANPGWRDFAVAADMVAGRAVPTRVSFDINPTSRQLLEMMIEDGSLGTLVAAGARIHQAGCNGCIGMGQAPAIGRNSLRTTPRNFPGRSGTEEDAVFLCSPETATASALAGRITDPREMGRPAPRLRNPERTIVARRLLAEPPAPEEAAKVELVKGPNIKPLPRLEPLPERLKLPVLLVMGDDVSTDEIMPAGARVLPYRSNIPMIATFSFERISKDYVGEAQDLANGDGHAVIGGHNYGQGSSREHAAIGPRSLGLRAVLAKSFARIHRQNLVNFGVLPMTFRNEDDAEAIGKGDTLVLEDLHAQLKSGEPLRLRAGNGEGREIEADHDLSPREMAVLLAGGLINWRRARH
ncbi:MAG TPA: aconitate hydratase [Alphaproteobacteria bacterium]|nr:aconitate hydratase [Alphaproteobacteria bacterium]